MALITWSEGLSVGVKEFDEQHKKLVGLLNELHEAMKLGKGKEIISTIIKNLIEYTQNHFTTEEKQMTKYSFPDQMAHNAEHAQFVQKVVAFQKDFNSGNILLSMDIMNFLKDWLSHHILITDKKYGPFFNGKGVK